MLTWEPEGHGKTAGRTDNSTHKYGEKAFAKIYRYVVVRARPKQGYSMCLSVTDLEVVSVLANTDSRISTHGGRGTVSKLLNQSEHSVIYTGDTYPGKLKEERKLNKDPIRVIPVDASQNLDPLSRIHFARHYPVEHNVKVRNVGAVAPQHIRRLVGYYKLESGFEAETDTDTPMEPVKKERRESTSQSSRGNNHRKKKGDSIGARRPTKR